MSTTEPSPGAGPSPDGTGREREAPARPLRLVVPKEDERARRKHRRLRRAALVALVLFALLFAAAMVSYVPYMLRPSNVPFAVRSVEWLRDNHMSWFVNRVEAVYYGWKAPERGGPAPKSLAVVGDAILSPKHTAVRERTYLPHRVRPVVHPALPGEGVWRSATRMVAGSYPVLVTRFRPERDYPQLVASVAWIDTTRTQLALYPGRYEPPSAHPRGPSQVPAGQRDRLLATFNGGFKYEDGRGGFAVNGRTYAPMVAYKGTIVALRDGTVDVAAWRGGREVDWKVVLARQNLPLIVNDGRPSPKLNATDDWGSTLGNSVRVWRSGVGVDGRGNLLYLAAPGQTAPSLARAFVLAGAVRAIELDINPEWPCFIAYRSWGADGPSLVVDTGMSSKYRYLAPDDRDFFAVYRREPGASLTVPFD